MTKKNHSDEKIETPKEKPIDALEQENAELVLHLQRLQAEFENYRKRTQLQLSQAQSQAADNLIKDMLAVLDNLTLAVEHTKQQLSAEELLKGVLMVQEQLQGVLADQGIATTPTSGMFNPTFHEALMTVESDKPSGEIVQVFSQGYTRNGRVIRNAKVSVAR